MIVYINPVANIPSVAVNRNLLIGHSVRECERQKFFGKLSRTVIVSTTSNHGVESECVTRCTNEMFSSRLGRSVRTIRRERRCLCKKRGVVFRQTSHDLIG